MEIHVLTALCETCHGSEHITHVSNDTNVICVNNSRKEHHPSIICGDQR